MFNRSTRTAVQTETLATLVDSSVQIKGEVTFEKSARIDGIVTGNVTGSSAKGGTLIVGATSTIKGRVSCHSVVVLGRVQGDIEATQLEIRAGAVIDGDILYDVVEIHQGSSINGRMVRRGGGPAETAETPKKKV